MKKLKYIISIALGLSVLTGLNSINTQATLPGTLAIDENRYWEFQGLNNEHAAYLVCEGYIGSPALPNKPDILRAYSRNCEITPPAGTPGIIDVPENHDPEAHGYPAYPVRSVMSQQVYFVCDGFLNSTSWCSDAAAQKAKRIISVMKPRNWELGSEPIFINDQKPEEYVKKQMDKNGIQLNRHNAYYNEPYIAEYDSVIKNEKPVKNKKKVERLSNYNHNYEYEYEDREYSNQEVYYEELSPENSYVTMDLNNLKMFIKDTVEEVVNNVLDKRLK